MNGHGSSIGLEETQDALLCFDEFKGEDLVGNDVEMFSSRTRYCPAAGVMSRPGETGREFLTNEETNLAALAALHFHSEHDVGDH